MIELHRESWYHVLRTHTEAFFLLFLSLIFLQLQLWGDGEALQVARSPNAVGAVAALSLPLCRKSRSQCLLAAANAPCPTDAMSHLSPMSGRPLIRRSDSHRTVHNLLTLYCAAILPKGALAQIAPLQCVCKRTSERTSKQTNTHGIPAQNDVNQDAPRRRPRGVPSPFREAINARNVYCSQTYRNTLRQKSDVGLREQ